MGILDTIAQGTAPIDYSNTLARIAALRQRDTALAQDQQQIDQRNALMKQAQAEQDQQTADEAAQEQAWLAAIKEGDATGDYSKALQIDPQHTQMYAQAKVALRPQEPPAIQDLGGGVRAVVQGGKIVGSPEWPQRAPIQGATSDMQNFRYFQGLTPEQQAQWSQVNGGARGVVGGVDPLTGEGLDMAAETYRTTGKLPTGLYRVPGATIKVINRSAELAAAAGDNAQATILRQQAFNANKTAMASLAKQKAMVGAFEKTADKNLGLVLSLSDQLSRSDVPLLNRAIVNFRQNITGDPKTASFVNALIAARTEYAKVLSGATGAQGITDSARREAEDLFNKASTPEQLRAVVATARQEMANRMSSFDDQLKELQVLPGAKVETSPQTPGKSSKTVTRTGMYQGRKVVQYSDGSVEYQ